MKNFILENKTNLKRLSVFYIVSSLVSCFYYLLYLQISKYFTDNVYMPVGFVTLTGIIVVSSLIRLLLPNIKLSRIKDVPFVLWLLGFFSIVCIVGFFSFVPFFAIGKVLIQSGIEGLLFFIFPPAIAIHVYAYWYIEYHNDRNKFEYYVKIFLGKLFFNIEDKSIKC